MDLVDIGANLTHRDFRDDLPEVLERARETGVVQIVVTGTSEAESRRAQALAERYPGSLFATAGVHPHVASGWGPRTLHALEELLTMPGVVAVGETGLDFYRDYSPRPAQERAFEAQLELAADRRVPVFLHERGAHRRFVEVLARYRERLPGAVVHCFTGTRDELWAYLDLDLHVGITGWICDERRGTHLLELVRHIPGDRLMLETDAPYLLPRTLPPSRFGRRNEPAHLTAVVAAVAGARGESGEEVARATSATARAFFGLPSGPTSAARTGPETSPVSPPR
jgi:TatD DNase family protein